MDYESLYSSLNEDEKAIKSAISSVTKLGKTFQKDLESGDIEDLISSLEKIKETAVALESAVSISLGKANSFDGKAYFKSGDFASQLLDCCKQMDIDAHGEYPVFEMFPYRVKLDDENLEVSIDKTKYACLRPAKIAEIIKSGQEKLNKAPFKAEAFLNELFEAYKLAILKAKKGEGSDILLTDLYKLMVPMARSRKEYDVQSFAFDLARLFNLKEDVEMTKDGHFYQFGPTRDVSKAIRVLDKEGKEFYLSTISFFKR